MSTGDSSRCETTSLLPMIVCGAHRRSVGPSFTPELYDNVWRTASQIHAETMSSAKWSGQDAVCISHFDATLSHIVFLIISTCGSGLHLNSTSDPGNGPSSRRHESTEAAFKVVSESFIQRLVIPCWAYKLPFKHVR